MLIDSTSTITIVIYYKIGKSNTSIKVETDFNKIPEKEQKKFKTVTFKMRQITWQISNNLMRKCQYRNQQTGADDIDWIGLKEEKLKQIIISWDYKDSNGKDVPVTNEAIMKLHPLVAEEVLQQYDLESYLSNVEKKNLVLEVDKYVRSSSKGQQGVTPPPEIIELSLMEKFGWTPEQIDAIPMKRLQRLFVVMNQRDASAEEAMANVAAAKSKQ
jgi:hypothetical protein